MARPIANGAKSLRPGFATAEASKEQEIRGGRCRNHKYARVSISATGFPGRTTSRAIQSPPWAQPAPTPGHWLLIVHVPGHMPVAFDSYARDFGIAFQPHLAGHARTHGDVDQFRADHCGQLCCAAAMIFRDHGLEVMRAAA